MKRSPSGSPAAPTRPARSFRLAPLAGALLSLAVAGAPAQAQKRGTVQMPTGWSDAYFDKLTGGEAPQIVVAVIPFNGGELVEPRLRFKMSDILITALVKAGRFKVVERERLDAILNEQKLQASGVTDSATAIRLGKLLNADLVIFGTVTSATEQKIDKFSYDLMRSEVSVDVRAVNTATSTIVVSETAKGSADAKVITTASGTVVSGATNYDALHVDAARQALDRVAVRVAEAFPLVAVVVQNKDGQVTIDAGDSRGVKPGDTFVVFRKGGELVHPVTKKHLGWEKTVLATIEVTSSESDLSTAKVTVVNGAAPPIQPGDLAIQRPAAAGR